MTSFTVAAIVDEPVEILARFVGWYLGQGAREVVLYFDNPSHPGLSLFDANPMVTAIACRPDFWHALRSSPQDRFTLRQNIAINHAYHGLRDGWLLNVDGDELVYCHGRRIVDLLAAQPDEVLGLTIETAEYVRVPGGPPTFRLPIPREAVGEVYGPTAGLFRRRFGLIGHAYGKTFHRAGQRDIALRQHWATGPSGEPLPARHIGRTEEAYLLHYIAPDFPRWRAKMEWRMNSQGFSGAVKTTLEDIRAREPDIEQSYQRLYRQMHEMDSGQVERLRAAGGLLELPQEFTPPFGSG